MEKRPTGSRGEPIASILKKTKKPHTGDLFDKSAKIKREKNISKKSDVNIRLAQGCTPLMYACQQADYKAVVDILNKDPSAVRVRDRGLRSALHYCASSGTSGQSSRAACADRLLMAAPALADARDADGLTPLHLAVVHGNVPLVQTLLAAGADVNAQDHEQHTVVHWATVCGEVGALRAVLAAGADPATPDQHGGYPLHYAAQMCGAPAATDHQSRGAALEVLRALVKEGGARVDVRDADGRTPLLWAASAGSATAVLALHQAGAKVDDADRDGLTALHCAAARGHTEALETLVGLCGARVDVADSHGCTPLHYAAALGHADATSSLLEHGADAHRQDRRGRSPAHTAAAKGQIETIRILGAKGANLWLRNSKGDLPLHEAVSSGRRELVKWLLDGRPSQVNSTNHEGRTPLHIAAATDNADLCRLLLDRGADVNPVARSSKNEPLTPLDCAASRGHRSTAKYIQMHGGLPASKLSNTQIVIDGAPIVGLPTRKVTSTKIDVRDRIRIEKREVVELSSPNHGNQHIEKYKSNSESSSESISDLERKRRKSDKTSDRYADRRKGIIKKQKSFSDGCDSDFEEHKRYTKTKHRSKKDSKSRKNRSRSEPSRKTGASAKGRKKYRSSSESSSDTNTSGDKKKKHQRKKSTKRYSSTSESSLESSDRRSTKRRGKKTSIHIENDDKKQTVNIVKYKELEPNKIADIEKQDAENQEPDLQNIEELETENVNEKKKSRSKTHSETETDTLSVKTNMVVTEAQIHMERDSSQHGSSELNVTVDSSNNVSIETVNLSVTHKDLSEDTTNLAKSDSEKKEENFGSEKIASNSNAQLITDTKVEEAEVTNESNKVLDPPNVPAETTIELDKQASKDDFHEPKNDSEESNKLSVEKDIQIKDEGAELNKIKSFQVLSGPDEMLGNKDNVATKRDDIAKTVSTAESVEHPKIVSSMVSFSDKDTIMPANGLEKSADYLMGEEVKVSEEDIEQSSNANEKHNRKASPDDIKKRGTSVSGSSTESGKILQRNIIILDQRETSNEENKNSQENLSELSPRKDMQKAVRSQSSSRKNSIYETESYKVLSDVVENTVGPGSGILKKSSSITDAHFAENISEHKIHKESSFGRIPSISDNEIYYSHSEANGRRKRFRKKGRTKSRITIRSKSENSERGYDSSGLMDSGFEPSPRPVQRFVASPRLNAYYQQRRSARLSGKSDSKIPIRKPGDKNAVDMRSVTQQIQTNMRRYYCERKIFQHLLELKRLQIRTSKANEAVLVKRAIDEYNKSSLSNVGLGPYNNPDYSFSSFEKFLYESLRKLQKSGKKQLDNLPEKPIDFDYGESNLYKMSAIPDNPCLCTSKTHRCYHAVHAYTGIPCSAYIPYKWNHHTMPKPSTAGARTKTKSFLPKINSKPLPSSGKPHVTLEVSHGTERQLIALPAERLDKNKRYYVTFTVKGSETPSDNDNASPKSVNNSV